MISKPDIPRIFNAVLDDQKTCKAFIASLRQELKDNLPVEFLQENTRSFWRNHITRMMLREERSLAPFSRQYPELIRKLTEDHNDILELLINIDKQPELFSFHSLANLLEMHIIWEERELLPRLAKVST